MSWKRVMVVLAGLAIGISVPVGLVNTPVSSGVVTAKAADTEKGYHGKLGTNCTWDLSANGETLTITGGDGGGTLPEGVDSLFNGGVIYNSIDDDIQNDGGSYGKLNQLTTINLSGKLNTGESAGYLFAGFTWGGPITLNGLETLNTSNTEDMKHMFEFSKFKSLDLSKFDTQNVTDMSNMFGSNDVLQDLDLSNFNTSNVTDMSGMFSSDSKLDKLTLGDNFKTGSVTTMRQMFFGTNFSSLDSILKKIDTSQVTDMSSMFSNMEEITSINVSGLDTSKVIYMGSLFQKDKELSNITFGGKFDTSNVQGMSYMFSGLDNLTEPDLSQLDTSSVTSMAYMFSDSVGLEKLDLSQFDTENVTSFMYMFYGDSNLKEAVGLSRFTTSNVVVFQQMFDGCSSLEELDLSNFNIDKSVRDTSDGKFEPNYGVYGMFANDTSLTSLNISGFNMKMEKPYYTPIDNMFDGDKQLSRLVLGPGARFMADGLTEGVMYGPSLPNIVSNTEYTGAWQAVGTGTDDNPQGTVYDSSDELVQAYEGDDRPSGIQTYVWQPVNRPAKPVNPVTPATPKPTTPTPVPDEPDEVFTGSSLNAIKKIGFYRQPTFTKKNRITWFAKAPRTRQPQFVVIGKATSRHGVARYQVRDVNRQSPTYKKTGYITTRTAYVEPTYVAKTSRAKTITVINPRGINGYGKVNLTQKHKHYRQGQQLKVKRIVTHNLTTRFQLTNGQYVTANRQWIQTGKRQYPRQITTKHTIWRYHDVNFRKQTHHYRKHQRLQVRGWDYSDHGTLRYRVAGGYVTANARWVQAVKS